MAKYPGTLETNNINEFGIVFADQIQGHRSVSNLDSLYKLTVAQLSKSKNNNGNDAIGQEWYVISESKKYKLIDWTKRNQTGGWEAINNVSEDEFNKKLNELEQKIVNNIDWKETVNTFADIATTYPNPQDGWTVSVKDTNKIYRYDAESKTWIPIFENTTELATASRNGLMSATYAKKLDGIETGANKYIHPTSHPATIITQDSTHRFVTDAEKTLWNKGGNNPFPGFGGNGSANTASRSDHTHDYTTIKTDANHRWITDTLLTKLNGIETGANKYIHPSTHPATIITQDSTHRFVTDTEKTTWNNKADANHTHSVVETANRLTQHNLTNQDLNTIKGSNYYNKFFYAAGGETTTNKPSDVNAYGLIVLRSAGGHTTQLLTSTNLNTGLYWRGGVNDNLGSWKKLAFITDNVASATKLLKPRTINGTNFDGSVNITTSIWGTTRNITIGNAKKTVNGSADVAWSLTEIGAAASNHNHDSVYAKLSHTHPLSQISDLHSSWDAVLKAQYQSPTVDTTKLVKNSGTTTLNSPTWDNGQVKIQFGLNFINIGFGNGSYYTFSTLKNEAEHLKFYNIIDKKFYRAAYLEKEQTWSAYQDFASGAGNSGSDMRFKVNIKPFENVLDKIKNLEIIEYKWNKKGEERDTFGLNATQIKKLFPKMWHQRQDKEKTEWLEYDRTGVIALKAIQELINENNSLKNDIEYLKKEIQNLKNK